MNDIGFLKNFLFRELCFKEDHYTRNCNGVNLHFIGYMKEGRGVLTTSDGSRIELCVGDMFYIPKGCKYHSHWIAESGCVRFDSIGFLYFPSKSPNGYILQKVDYNGELFEKFRPLSESKELNTSSIGRTYALLGEIEDSLVEAPVDTATGVAERMVMLMHKDPHRSVADYAGDCGVSESGLYLYVKRAMGTTPNKVRQNVLCDKAVQLLETTNLTVEEICGRVGFSSSSYFRKVLWAVRKKTPSEIRKEATTI
ncbi:MAG: helix-turn-helix transcriptional regulator [Clostridia bacterium]|nr:helix-turn-helix transcriptional regulator [Clostridia bacterium]